MGVQNDDLERVGGWRQTKKRSPRSGQSASGELKASGREREGKRLGM